MNNFVWKPIEELRETYTTVVLTSHPNAVKVGHGFARLGYKETDGRLVGNGVDGMKITHFAELPTEVVGPVVKPIMIAVDGTNREVEILDNGDIKVGCTTVDSKTMDAIIERRKAAKRG